MKNKIDMILTGSGDRKKIRELPSISKDEAKDNHAATKYIRGFRCSKHLSSRAEDCTRYKGGFTLIYLQYLISIYMVFKVSLFIPQSYFLKQTGLSFIQK